MSATDYRKIIDTLGGGFIAIECSDGEHVGVNVNIGMSVGVCLDLSSLDALQRALADARAVIEPVYHDSDSIHIDNNLDRRPD